MIVFHYNTVAINESGLLPSCLAVIIDRERLVQRRIASSESTVQWNRDERKKCLKKSSKILIAFIWTCPLFYKSFCVWGAVGPSSQCQLMVSLWLPRVQLRPFLAFKLEHRSPSPMKTEMFSHRTVRLYGIFQIIAPQWFPSLFKCECPSSTSTCLRFLCSSA